MEEKRGYAWMLRSPARRAILLYLAEHGPSRFVEIKKHTGLSTGVIYHHIRSLEGYVVQDENRMYRLTEGGMRLASLISDPQQRAGENQPDTAAVNDLLLEFYPTATKLASYIGLTPVYRRLNGLGIQLAVAAACLEFILLISPHIYPFYTPAVLGVYGFGVAGSLETFAISYLIVRLSVLALTGSTPTQSPGRLASKLSQIFDPELLSTFSLGLALTYLSFLVAGAPLVGQAASLTTFFFGYFAIASAASYNSGLELIPSLLIPFAMDMFDSAAGQILFEGYLEPSTLAFDLAMGSLALLAAGLADRSMKKLFARGLGGRHQAKR